MTQFEQIARDFISTKISPATRDAYTRDLGRWLAHCQGTGADPGTPSTADAVAFRSSLEVKKLAPQSVRRTLAALSSFYTVALAREKPAATWNPFAPRALERPRSTEFSETDAVAESDWQLLITTVEADMSPDGLRDTAMLWLLHATGLRRAAIANVRREDILRDALKTTTKDGKRVEVRLSEKAVDAVKKWVAVAPKSPYLFPNARDVERPICVTKVNDIIRDRAVAAKSKHVHPHQFRVAYITAAFNAEVPLQEVQAAAHHADPRTTLRYDRGRRGSKVADAVARWRGEK